MAARKWGRVVGLSVLTLIVGTVAAEQSIDENAVGNSSATMSFAAQIAQAANLIGVQDQELLLPEDMPDRSRSAVSRSLDLGMAAGTASGAITSGAVSPGMGASLWLISSMLPSKNAFDMKASSKIFAWMPIEMANDEKTATEKLTEIYVDAIKKSLPEHEITRLKTSVRNGGNGGGLSVQIKGPLCPDTCKHAVFNLGDPDRGKAPEQLGGYSAYVWKIKEVKKKSNFVYEYKNFLPIGVKHLTKEDRVAFYQELSNGLPEWVFLYMAPNEKASPLPVIYNAGVPNYFIKPENNNSSVRY